MKTRGEILGDLRKLRAEVDQIFIDAASWNQNSQARKDGAEPVDPDPYGEMRRLATAIDEVLANDPGHGPIAPLKFERSH